MNACYQLIEVLDEENSEEHRYEREEEEKLKLREIGPPFIPIRTGIEEERRGHSYDPERNPLITDPARTVEIEK